MNRTVHKAAKLDRASQLPDDVYKKLSKSEKRYLEGASASELESTLQTYLVRATSRQEDVQTSTKKRARTERGTTKFLNDFHGYVQAYSGVIQIMNGAGPGYGDAAYGALSLFLVVNRPTVCRELLGS
jgi:hypothetical protein